MFKVDLHVHTKEVSPCGKVLAKKHVLEYKKAGYNGIVICDHFNKKVFSKLEGVKWKTKVKNFLEGYRTAKEAGEEAGIRVYLGLELRNEENNNDYLIYGADENFLYENKNLFLKKIDEIKKIADQYGVLLIQAHPFRVVCTPVDDSLVHGREVFNGHFNHNSQNELARELAEKSGAIMTSGSDAHYFCDIGNGGVIFQNEPENIAVSLREGNYTLIETPKQWANILFLNGAEENKIKIARAFYEIDAIAETSENGLVVKNSAGEEVEKENGIFKINRIQLVCGKENLKNANIQEPIVLLDKSVNENTKEVLVEMGALLCVTEKSDDTAPYTEGLTTYIGFDMTKENMFIADIMGPSVKLEKIEL